MAGIQAVASVRSKSRGISTPTVTNTSKVYGVRVSTLYVETMALADNREVTLAARGTST